jgi:imidazolonepropionase-like amidohydrolase
MRRMTNVSNIRYLFLILAGLFTVWTLSGQSRREDRRAFLSPGTPTTDDPRRIPVPNVPRGPEGVLVLKGGRIFDSVKSSAYPGTLVIERNRIRAVLPPESSDWPKDARVIDVAGKTVMPGLIDLHTHITNPDPTFTPVDEQQNEASAALIASRNLRYYIEDGVTSIRDLGSLEMVPYILKERVAANKLVGPRLFVAGKIITGLGGHGTERPLIAIHTPPYRKEVSGPDEWRNAVREEFKRGADLIKVASHFAPAEVRAAVEEAHNLGLKVTCDCETFYIQWAVEAGVDIIEHPLPRSDDTIRLMAERHVESDPTLIPYHMLLETSGGYWGSTSRRFTLTREGMFSIFAKMKAAGIKMGVGTDTATETMRYQPNSYITELKLFVENGYSVKDVLVAATKTNAEILDMDDKLGTLERGKLADVIVVDGNPDIDLDDLRKIDKVIRDGYIVVDGGQVVINRPGEKADATK